MAEPNMHQSDKTPPPGNGSEVDIEDPEVLKAQLREANKRIGQYTNDNKKLREVVDKAKSWQALAEAGHTAEEVMALFEKRQEADLHAAREKGEGVDKVLEAKERQHAKELAKLKEEIARKQEILEQKIINDELRAAIAAIDVAKPYRDAVFHLHRHKIKLVPNDDSETKVSAVVEVEPGQMLSVEAYMRHWAETNEDAGAFLSQSRAGGGGATAGGMNAARLRFKKRSEMTDKEKAAFYADQRAQGKTGAALHEAYMKLPA